MAISWRSVRKVSILSQQVKLTDRSWPFLCSFTLNTLIFAILFCPAFQNPAETSTDSLTVFWLPSFITTGNAADTALALQGPSIAFAGQNETPTTASQSEAQAVDTTIPPPLTTVPETSAANPGDPVEAVDTATASLTVTKSAAQAEPVVPTSSASRSDPLPVQTTSHKPSLPLEPDPDVKRATQQSLPSKQLELPSKRQIAKKSSEQKQRASETAQLHPGIKENAQSAKVIERAADKKTLQEPLAPAPTRPEKPLLKVSEKTRKEQRPVQQSSRPIEPAPMIIKGDLKLAVNGTAQITATITFKEFAQSRRDRPFSRSEAKRETKISPHLSTTQNNSLEIVIEHAKPGVYTFTVEPADGQVNVAFSLKLYDGTSRKVIKDLGKRSLAQKTVLCKVLMPEGILWDDSKDFTGSMEDSESITKFNAATGLMWKEYAD